MHNVTQINGLLIYTHIYIYNDYNDYTYIYIHIYVYMYVYIYIYIYTLSLLLFVIGPLAPINYRHSARSTYATLYYITYYTIYHIQYTIYCKLYTIYFTIYREQRLPETIRIPRGLLAPIIHIERHSLLICRHREASRVCLPL